MTPPEGGPPPDDPQPPSAPDPSSTVRPQTPSVLAALANRGLDLPGLTRPATDTPSTDSASPAEDAPRYTVLEQVARGGMGVVMRVRDEDLRRDLAMKVLDRAGREPDSLSSDPRDLGRFLEEAQVTGQLDHPGVPPIHELGLDRDGRLFFTMKLVRGGTFLDVITDVHKTREGWTTTRALGVVLKVCEALAYAHHKGVVHRDIKPANIMVGRFGETYVMDWGLAKVVDDTAADGGHDQPSYDNLVSRSIVHTDRREAVGDTGSSFATLDGDIVGTPAYMAPEQARGDLGALGPHTDIYAVGTLLYHLIAGQAPYLEPGVRVSPHSVLRWVLDGPPKSLAELAPDAPAELVAVIDKAMAREPTLRYTSMLDLAGDLQAFIEDRVVRAYQSGAWAEARKWMTRNKPLAAAAGLLLVVTLGALGAISWVQSTGRAAVEDKNLLLGQSNAALESANTQLGEANDALGSANAQLGQVNAALEDKNVQLADTNAALDIQRTEAERARTAAEQARELAQENAELAETNAALAAASAREAEANERRALEESYAANMTAALSALDAGAGAAARRHLASCPEDLRGWDWRHLSLRADPSLHVWKGSDSMLFDVDHSPDGTLLATANGPYEDFGAPITDARLLDATTGEILHVLPTDQTVTQVAFSPDGKVLAYATPQYISLWDVERERPRGSRHWIGNLCMSLEFLDKHRLVSLAVDQDIDTSHVELWNITRQEVEFELDSTPAITSVTASPDGTSLAIGRSDHSVELLSLPGGESVWLRTGIEMTPQHFAVVDGVPGVSGLAFDARGQRLVVTNRDGVVQLLDARDGRELVQHVVAEGTPFTPRFHPDGPWVLLGDSSGSVRFLDAHDLTEIERLSGHDQVVLSLSISPDGDQLVSADMLGNLRTWDGRPGAATLKIANPMTLGTPDPDPDRRAVCFSPDGRLVVWAADSIVVLLADALTGEVRYRLAEADSNVGGLAFTPDGRRVLVQTEVDGLLTFDVADGRLLSAVPGGAYADGVFFDRTGSLMAVVEGQRNTRIDLRGVESGAWAARLDGHEGPVSQACFTADSQRIVSSSLDGNIRTWDLRSRSVSQRIYTRDFPITLELFDGDRRAITTSGDPTRSGMSVWDLEAGELIVRHQARGLTLAGSLHPDGTLWAGANTDGSVSLWSVERGEMFSLPAGDLPITNTLFDPTGTRLAAIDRGGHLYLWDTVHPRDRSGARRAASRLARHVGEARVLVDALFEEHLLLRRVLDALEADTTLADDLRDATVREARVRGDGGRWVAAQLWERLLPADVPDGQLATAPRAVAAAEALLPHARDLQARWEPYSDAWEPLIWSLYVLGHNDEVAQLMPPGIDFGYSFNPSGPKVILVLRALYTAKQGDMPLARAQLARAREAFEYAQSAAPGEVSDLAVTARLLSFAEARFGGE